jgi:hypothetical protein
MVRAQIGAPPPTPKVRHPRDRLPKSANTNVSAGVQPRCIGWATKNAALYRLGNKKRLPGKEEGK